jgi:hypothetical protein
MSRTVVAIRAPRQDLFCKTVYVVHSRPREPLTLVQRKLANAWLKTAIEHKPDAKSWWTMPLSRLREDIAFPSNNTFHLKDAARTRMQSGLRRCFFCRYDLRRLSAFICLYEK